MSLERALIVFAAAACLTPAPAAAQSSELREKMALWARDIAQLVKDQGGTEAAVGEFPGPPAPASAAGPSIQLVLVEELQKRGVKLNDEARLVVEGKYFPLEEVDGQKIEDLRIRLVANIRVKGTTRTLKELSAEIGFARGGNADLVKLLAMNADLSAHTKTDVEGENAKLKRDLEKPPLALVETKIQVSKDSPFAVEVLTRAPKGPLTLRQPTARKKQAFVEIPRGQEFVLRLHNTSDHEAAVTVTLDGVDAFRFYSPPNKRPSSFLVAAGKTRDVVGWPRDNHKVSAFLIGSFTDSPAARLLKSSARLGVITVCFHPCWTGNAPRNYEGARSAASNAVVEGREIAAPSQVVKRNIGPLAAAVSIRYSK